ncbi:MAG: hypothetical protein H0Z33_10575 [Bacillaceae bacterium]|nr:hypothetical protein [Bacillaceae bacterium]
MNIYEGEQSNEMSPEVAAASLRYYQEAFHLDIQKLMAGDESEWAKTRQFPPAFVMQLEELICRCNGEDQRYWS